MPDLPLLEFRGVRAAYEEVEVLHGIEAEFDEGVVTAVLGANGAGKSTLLALAAGIMAPTEGEVRFAGHKVVTGSTSTLARRGMCLIPEGRGVFPNLTVRENLWVMTNSGAARRHVEHSAFDRFPPLAVRPRTAGRHLVWWRAADAGTGTRRGHESSTAHARRALHGPGAHRRPGALQTRRPTGGGGHHCRGGRANLRAPRSSVATSAIVMANGRVVQTGAAGDVESVLHSAYLGTAQAEESGSSTHESSTELA